MRHVFMLFAIAAAAHLGADASSYYPQAGTPASLPGLYQRATPAPTPLATPDLNATHIQLFTPSTYLDLRGGLANPLGNTSNFNASGWSLAGDLVYHASQLVDIGFTVSYASMPYSLTTAAQPLTSMGLGLRAIVNLMSQGDLHFSVDGGMGYYFEDAATVEQVGTTSLGLPINQTVYQSAGGIGFNLGANLSYYFTPKFSVLASADVISVSQNGGTGTNTLYITPDVGVSYTF